jgi:hypothetical protein
LAGRWASSTRTTRSCARATRWPIATSTAGNSTRRRQRTTGSEMTSAGK